MTAPALTAIKAMGPARNGRPRFLRERRCGRAFQLAIH
nr:MAG TPA: hypothetical protein [Caudoviricetes sp.]